MTVKRGFGGLNTSNNSRDARPEEKVRIIKLGKDFKQLRLHGEVQAFAQRWISIETKKGVINIPKVALNYDAATDSMDTSIEDPYEEIPNEQKVSKKYFVNAIERDVQDEEPRKKEKASREERKTGLMDGLKSKTWTPNAVLGLPPQAAGMVQALIPMNKHKVKGKVQEMEVTDEEYGCDIFISYDEKATPKYNVQKGDHTPMTDEEKEYLKWKLDDLLVPEPIAQARKEAEQLAAKCPVDEDTEEEEDDEDDALAKRNKKRREGKADKPDRSERKSGRAGREERSSSKSGTTREERIKARKKRRGL